MSKMNIGEIFTKVAAFGVAGWALENALCGDRYSSLFRGQKVPFLPIYAVNGVALTSVASYISNWPTLGRGLVYAALGTAVEYVGCQIDRKFLTLGPPGYGGYGGADPIARVSEGCVNWTRSALWGGMGLVAEKFAR